MTGRLRRAWRQLVCPSSSYYPLADCYMVPVSAQMVDAAGGWSQPVQVRIQHTSTDRYGGDVQMLLRRYDAVQAALEAEGLA